MPRRASAQRTLRGHPHGAYLPANLNHRRAWNLAFRLLLGRAYLTGAAAVHAITAIEGAALERYGRPRRLAVIPNPIDPQPPLTSDERATARQSLGLAPDDLLLLFLGRLDVWGKGLDVLIQGFGRALAAAGGSRLHLMLVGPREPGPVVEALIAPTARGAVTVSPPAFGADKRRLLAAADAFITLTRWDVMPTAVLDALALGLSVLVSEEAGFGDFVRHHDAGQVVSHAPAAIADLIGSLDQSELARKREAIREAAEHEFSPERVAGAMEALYREAQAPIKAAAPVQRP